MASRRPRATCAQLCGLPLLECVSGSTLAPILFCQGRCKLPKSSTIKHQISQGYTSLSLSAVDITTFRLPINSINLLHNNFVQKTPPPLNSKLAYPRDDHALPEIWLQNCYTSLPFSRLVTAATVSAPHDMLIAPLI